ncbi:hypothetical protein [Trinickia fusca]|nr:hypothetical protein [Trinickia fusca]
MTTGNREDSLLTQQVVIAWAAGVVAGAASLVIPSAFHMFSETWHLREVVGAGLMVAMGIPFLSMIAMVLTAVPSFLLYALARTFRICRLPFYAVGGAAMGVGMVPLWYRWDADEMRTWLELLVDPGLRFAISGLFGGLVFWRLRGRHDG